VGQLVFDGLLRRGYASAKDQAVDGYPPPPIWARLTMLALKDLNVPSLSVQDSIIVQGDRETLARETLSNLYKATTAAAPPHRYGVADSVRGS
jgi:hypothetical protein